jgi:hypothetical protein
MLASTVVTIMNEVWELNSQAPEGYQIGSDAIERIVKKHYPDDSTDTQDHLIALIVGFTYEVLDKQADYN